MLQHGVADVRKDASRVVDHGADDASADAANIFAVIVPQEVSSRVVDLCDDVLS